MSIIIHHLIATLKMPSKWADRILRAQTIQTKLTGNTNFPVGSWPANIVTLAQLGIDITAFIAAQSAVTSKTGTTAARDAAFLVVKNDLEALKGMVQVKADANIPTAATIITGAGYFVKKSKVTVKKQNDALNTEISGTVLLTSDAAGHHQWEMSKDMVTIIPLPPTSTSHTLVPGLNPGDVWWFRNKRIDTKKTTYNWSPWVQLRVGQGGKLGGSGTAPGHAGSLPATT
jgi:hypothetical protein